MRLTVRDGSRHLCWCCSSLQSSRRSLTTSTTSSIARHRSRTATTCITGSASRVRDDNAIRTSSQANYARAASTSTQTIHSHPSDAVPRFKITREIVDGPATYSPSLVDPNSKIRQELRQWHKDHGQADELISQYMGVDGLDADTQRLEDPSQANADGLDDLDLALDSPGLDDLDPQHRILRPGDMVEMQFEDQTKDPVLAVFVRKLGLTRTRQYYTATGKWVHAAEDYAGHIIPYYIDSELIQKLLPHLPNTNEIDLAAETGNLYDLSVPREVSAPIISRLAKYQNEVQALYRRHAVRLESAHDLLAHDSDLRISNALTIARDLLQLDKNHKLSAVELSTVRLALIRAGYAFGFDHKHGRLTNNVMVRSKEKVEAIARAQEWIRQYRDELAQQKCTDADLQSLELRSYGGRIVQSFARKCTELIKESRTDREPTQLGSIGPSKSTRKALSEQDSLIETRQGPGWSGKHRVLIKFMEAWVLERGFLGLSNLDAQPPLLLKATGMYNNLDLHCSVGSVFLQEIGHIAPWENRMNYEESVMLPAAGHSRQLANAAENISSDQTSRSFVIRDSLENVRKEKEHPATTTYCLDSPGAHEIDDGISIDPSSDDGTWVHIDVANPTAFLAPGSQFARIAQHMGETIYMPEHNHLMLPSWLTQTHFSLKSGRPSLRFSAKLDKEGAVVDHDVTAGFARNVQHVDPAVVNKALGLGQDNSKTTTLCVGGTPPDTQPQTHRMLPAEEMTPAMLDDLRRMLTLANKRSIIRGSKDGINLNASDRDVQVWANSKAPGLGWKGLDSPRSRFFQGDPIILTKAKEFKPFIRLSGQTDARGMVQEFMLLASYIASKWMHDRGLPNLYRGSLPALNPDKETPSQYFHRVLVPIAEQHDGWIPEHLCADYLLRSNPSTISMEPLKHDQLGLTHYSRVTSPLRRYGDMVSHWQIGAVLAAEAKLGRKIKPVEAERIVPFPRKKLESLIPLLMAREARIKRLKQWGIKLWTSLLFFRGVHFGELDLPRTLTAYVRQPEGPMGYSSTFKDFDIDCIMEDAPTGTRPGDFFEVQISRVNVYSPTIMVRPTRLISRSEYEAGKL